MIDGVTSTVSSSVGVIPRRAGMRFLAPQDLWMLSPVPLGVLVSVFSLTIGAHVEYVILQLFLFFLLVPVLYLIKHDDRYSASMLLISFLKLFYISQIVSIVFVNPPDANLSAPLMTLVGLTVGLIAGLAGIGLARLIVAASPKVRPLLQMNITAHRLRRLGYLSGFVGLPAQVIWTFLTSGLNDSQRGGVGQLQSGLVVFSYLSSLEMLSLACFAAAELIDTRGRTFISRPFLAVLSIYLVATAPLAEKASPLIPLVVVFAVALQFRWKVRWVPVVTALLTFVFVSEVLLPVVTYSRMVASGQGARVPTVFLATIKDVVSDPSKLVYLKSFNENLDRGNHHLYFGRPAGLFERFTPGRTDQLVANSSYVEPEGPRVFVDALAAILPQALGFKRNTTEVSRHGEAVLFRHVDVSGKTSWENEGFIGDGFVAGGLPMAAAFMFLLGLLSSLAARMTFGAKRHNVFWLLFLPIGMLIADGSTFVGAVPLYFWPWMFSAGAVFVMLRWMERTDPGVLAA
jgi:hypothetical protein